ncbi:zf-MIZ-domain-containing protein [Rhizopus microsporus var. microsporus]|uniref:Zf-MIZ-domain-containing protein n=1 Tax=Rhizopus microsporus var. microsporus TaxID=86635 RepID=A0A1X0RIT8_RHIZD|nr:zf-MIZ-domain-containing protein [Rhizopus microsporus var. microsporus]
MPQRGMQQRVQNSFIPQQISPGYQSPQQQQFNNNNNISNQQQQLSAPVYIQPTQAQSQPSNNVGNSNALQKQAQQSQQQPSSISLAEIQAVSTAAMLPTTADLSIPVRLTNGNNIPLCISSTHSGSSSTSPTQPRTAQASTSSFGQQNALYLPNISQPSFDQLVLPNKTTGLIPALANDSDSKDLADFLRPSSAILGPFRLVHSQRVTEKQFFIGKNYFTSLFNETNNRVKSPEKLPLTFLFTAWHVKSQERKVEWPEHMRAEMNGKQLYLERKMRVDGRIPIQTGKDKAYDLNNVLQEGTNVLRIYQDDCACSFNFCIRLYVRESENYIVEKVRKTPLSIQKGKETIDKLLGKKDESDDDEIAIEQKTLRVSLKCPITLTRIKIPAKGIKCKHIDCFDLHDYLLLNKMERPMWTCPHCNDVVTSEQLGYDLFFEGLLKTLPKNVSEIEFKDNHSTITVTKEDDLDDDNSNSNSEDEDGPMDNKAIIRMTMKNKIPILTNGLD